MRNSFNILFSRILWKQLLECNETRLTWGGSGNVKLTTLYSLGGVTYPESLVKICALELECDKIGRPETEKQVA